MLFYPVELLEIEIQPTYESLLCIKSTDYADHLSNISGRETDFQYVSTNDSKGVSMCTPMIVKESVCVNQ